MAAHEALGPQFYHSTNSELNPGDIVQPGYKAPGKGGKSDDFAELGHHNFTWMSTEKPTVHNKFYGTNHYEVEPLGLHHPYSFKKADPEVYKTGEGDHWVSLAGAKVIRKIPDSEPRIGDTPEITHIDWNPK